MTSGEITLFMLMVVAVNAAVLKALLSCTTWQRVRLLLVLAVLVQVVSFVATSTLGQTDVMVRKLISAIAFGITGQILMFFLRNLVLVKMRGIRAKAFGQKIAPSQGFAKDYLLHIPQMRTEAVVVFLMVTVVEVVVFILPLL